MIEPLEIDLPGQTRRILQFIAEAGLIGVSEAEVARHLIYCGLQDMVRHGELSLANVDAKP